MIRSFQIMKKHLLGEMQYLQEELQTTKYKAIWHET